MTDIAHSTSKLHLGPRTVAGSRAALRREMLGWAWLSVGALVVAGIFAILLALSRIPGIELIFPWPLGFFAKGLVIHVVFSLIVWLLGVFAFLVTVATLKVCGDDVRMRLLGDLGQATVALAFPCLFVPAFFDSTASELVNYVPLIRHPAYDAGLLLLAIGILAPVLRLVVNLAGRKSALPPIGVAMSSGSFVYVIALSCFLIAAVVLNHTGAVQTSREQLFWGGGHLLEFVYTIVMITNWMILARESFGEQAIDFDMFRLSVVLIAVFSVPAPAFYRVFEAFSDRQNGAFRVLQFVLGLPTVLFAGSLLAGALKSGRLAQWPWRKPAFVALVVSLVLFAVGGTMGMLISGSDTRTPAHYHAVVTAVSVSSMGMFLTFALRELGKSATSDRAVRLLVLLYGGGQLFASFGMFLAGGYGAPRKAPTGAGSLVDIAAAGMFLHGIGALFAVLGGAAFVVVAFFAFRRTRLPRAGV